MSKISYQDLAEVIVAQIDAGKSADKVARQVAEYLVAERQVNELDRVMREVERLRFEQGGILEVTASSARNLSQDVQQQIKQLFKSDSVQVSNEINQDLVGGVRIQAMDTLIDLSVRGQLNRLKQHNF